MLGGCITCMASFHLQEQLRASLRMHTLTAADPAHLNTVLYDPIMNLDDPGLHLLELTQLKIFTQYCTQSTCFSCKLGAYLVHARYLQGLSRCTAVLSWLYQRLYTLSSTSITH